MLMHPGTQGLADTGVAQRAHLLLGLEVRRRSAGARGARRFALAGLLGCALGALALAADAETLGARLGLVGRVRACAAAAGAALGKALVARSLADRLLRARARLGDLKSNCAKRNAAGTAGKVCRLLVLIYSLLSIPGHVVACMIDCEGSSRAHPLW